ncbi:type VII secretion target [Actinokineospora xionganensis]|uniref:ESX-1 secretion-associated protein n=1 Tax=Actinokineospora xionganensis TaxID=2684470 RepID=A0ABR7L9C3_9PSEU|nr:type VII secretion target [Actinokineospora xionganensis]MBC6449108.1 ESX-1 secretion-associated protein [Actinokineospora xionganensis]
MGNELTVNSAEVRAHAAATDAFAGRADTATAAGAHLTTLNDAYGLLCQPFGAMVVSPQARGTEALGGAAKSLHEMSSKLTEAAQAYEDTEQRITDLMKQLVEQLDAAAACIPTVRGN